ncbi:MAG: glycosyltransferase [Deltaproteobacteria bacterium]|nr:glycosyltransferase [Deltaproteobacteria bacterium]
MESSPGSNQGPRRLTLSVIVPVYNERATIREILQRVASRPEVDELIIVDDCSKDGTGDVLREDQAAGWPSLRVPHRPLPRVVLLLHEVNQGKGAALRTGFEAATCDVFLTQDADLEYDPADYEKLMSPLYDGRADAVYGSRFAGYPRRVLFFWHSLGNKMLTTLSNMLCDLNLTDMETGYKAIRKDMVRSMTLQSNRFGIEPEITAKLARMRARIYEVPISYSGRSYNEGKKIGWKDAVSAVWTMLRCAITDDRGAVDPLHATLRRMAVLDRYNAFLFEQIKPAVGQRVLEVGAGTGNLTQFLRDRDVVVATDVDPDYVELLRRRFENSSNVDVTTFDLAADVPPDLAEQRFDTIICLNVLEHIADDRGAVERLRSMLQAGGRLLLLVPAHRRLYGTIDEAIGHHRRYERQDLVRLLSECGLEVESDIHVNATSIPGWLLNGRILKRRSVPGVQARIANRLVPLYRLERKLDLPFGLSVIAVARRAEERPARAVG